MRSIFGLFRGSKPKDVQPTPPNGGETDWSGTVTYTSGARAGESHVISPKLMEAQGAMLEGMMGLLTNVDNALAAFRRAGDLVLSYQGPVDQHALDLMADAANWLTKFEDTSRALSLFDRALEAAVANPQLGCETLSDKLREVGLLLTLPRVEPGLALLTRAVSLHRDRFGPRHERTGGMIFVVGAAIYDAGHYQTSLTMLREAAEISAQAVGEVHPDTARAYESMARSYIGLEQLDAAIDWAQRAAEIYEKARGANDPSVAKSLETLGVALKRKNDLRSAEVVFRRALGIYEGGGTSGQRESGIVLGNLAGVLLMTQRPQEALPLLHRALAVKEEAYGASSPSAALTLFQLANTYGSLGEFATALPLVARSCAIYEAALGVSHPDAQRSRTLLAQIEHDLRGAGQR